MRGPQAMTKLVEDHALAVDILEAQRAALTGDADALRSLTALAEGPDLAAALGAHAAAEDAELANIPASERKSGSGADGKPRKQQ